MQCGIITNIIVIKSLSVLKLLTTKDQSLLLHRNSLLFSNFGLEIINRLPFFDFH